MADVYVPRDLSAGEFFILMFENLKQFSVNYEDSPELVLHGQKIPSALVSRQPISVSLYMSKDPGFSRGTRHWVKLCGPLPDDIQRYLHYLCSFMGIGESAPEFKLAKILKNDSCSGLELSQLNANPRWRDMVPLPLCLVGTR